MSMDRHYILLAPYIMENIVIITYIDECVKKSSMFMER